MTTFGKRSAILVALAIAVGGASFAIYRNWAHEQECLAWEERLLLSLGMVAEAHNKAREVIGAPEGDLASKQLKLESMRNSSKDIDTANAVVDKAKAEYRSTCGEARFQRWVSTPEVIAALRRITSPH